jgi:charged multivesicular body protein 6
MLAKGDKKRALLALRRKKYQESLLAKTDAQLEQLEKLTSSVEFALIQKDVVFGLQQGTKVLAEIHREMGGIEHVEKLMGETADAIAYQRVRCARLLHRAAKRPGKPTDKKYDVQEVSELLGGKISVQDEEEVEDELAALEAEAKGTNLPNAPVTEPPPKVPTQDVRTHASQEDAEPQPAKREREAIPA